MSRLFFASLGRSVAVLVRVGRHDSFAESPLVLLFRFLSFVLGWARTVMGSAGVVGLHSLLHHARAASARAQCAVRVSR